MKKNWTKIVYFFFMFLFLSPGLVWAWGPAMHLYLGNTLLTETAIILPPVISLLRRWHEHFLYGSISADFFVGKGYRANGGKYHNWEAGMLIWHRAEGDKEKAFAAGFLAHLAADTVAHGCFIPHFTRHTLPNRVGHLYWEWLADRWVNKKEYNIFIKSACRYRGKNHCLFIKMDDFICEALALDRSLYLSRKSLYLYPVRVMAKSWPTRFSPQNKTLPYNLFNPYILGSLNVMANVLTLQEESPFLLVSPNYKYPKLAERLIAIAS